MSLSPFLALSIAGAALATLTSLAGILWPGTYAREAPAWAVQALGQDCANLGVAVLLLASAWRARRGSLGAVQVWLGCLLYFAYAFAIYAFAIHLNPLFLAYVAVLGLSFYAFAGALGGTHLVQVRPAGDPRRRQEAGNLLIAIGVLFIVLWLADLVPGVFRGSPPASLAGTGLWTNPVHVLDLALLLPGMVLGGVLLRRAHPWGLLLGVPLLVFAATMGAGILAAFAISGARGAPVPLPPVLLVGVVVTVSAVYAWRVRGAASLAIPGRIPAAERAATSSS